MVRLFVCLFLAAQAVLVPELARAADFDRTVVRGFGWLDAKCNDGSLSIYYVDEATGPERDRWLVYFQGGGGASNDQELAARFASNPERTTSGCFPGQPCDDVHWQPTRSWGGVFNDNPATNPVFAGWSRVFVPYCSSDGWSGNALLDTDPSVPGLPPPVHFKGHKIIEAVMRHLQQGRGTEHALADADEVIIAAHSAATTGFRHNLDRIADHMAPVPVRGIHDASFLGYVDQSGPTCTSGLGYPAAPTPTYGDRNVFVDASCQAAHGGDPAPCVSFYEQLEGAHIDTEMFVIMNQKDHKTASNKSITQTCEAQAVRDLFTNLGVYTTSVTGVWSPCSARHTTLATNAGLTATSVDRFGASVGLSWALDRWVNDGEPVSAIAPVCQ